MDLNFNNVSPGIVIAVYVFIEIIKLFIKSNKAYKLIPLISAVIGIIITIVLFYTQPDIINCANILEAVALGGLSGFAATGCNQLFKKLTALKDGTDPDLGYTTTSGYVTTTDAEDSGTDNYYGFTTYNDMDNTDDDSSNEV